MIKTCIARLYFHTNGAITAQLLSNVEDIVLESSEITGLHCENVIIDDEMAINTSEIDTSTTNNYHV